MRCTKLVFCSTNKSLKKLSKLLRSPSKSFFYINFRESQTKDTIEITTANENYRIKIVEVMQTDEGSPFK